MQLKQWGMTLVEMIFVLVIGSILILMGTRFYQSYKSTQELETLRFNINQLMSGVSQYFQAKCRGDSVLNQPQKEGTVYPVEIDPMLSGFLSKKWPNPTNLLDEYAGNAGYFAELVAGPLSNRYYSFCWMDYATKTPIPHCTDHPVTTSDPSPTVIVWYAKVVVKLADPTKTLAYAAMLDASCVSDQPIACNNEAQDPAYIIWMRLPTLTTPDLNTSFWQTLPFMKSFNLQYTHDQMYEYENSSYAKKQYYLCNGG